ncbi:hypothetical protein TNCV_565801 [Trichonephila clavipes]|nr:hypothetical protein TNCV_565801 [Trichonephila clavipes]
MDGKPLSDKYIQDCLSNNPPPLPEKTLPWQGLLQSAWFISLLLVESFHSSCQVASVLHKALLSAMVSQLSEDLEALRLPLEQIPISQRHLHLSQYFRYILLSNNIRLNIKIVALIQKNVDKLFAPAHLVKEIQQWFNSLKPQEKVDLVTESYLLLLFMLHLRFIYEKFPVEMIEIKSITLKVAESFLEALDECRVRPRKRLYYYAILGISSTIMGGCLFKLLG